LVGIDAAGKRALVWSGRQAAAAVATELVQVILGAISCQERCTKEEG
jgi:hypothetical protein